MNDELREAIEETRGILHLDAALVARDWLPPGRRLGLREEEYDVGERGFICERWLGSTTHADNRIGPSDEGVSYIRTPGGERLNLEMAVRESPEAILGREYARTHAGLGRLAKIYDFAARLPYHVHPPQEQAALVGRSAKDESSFFPSLVDMGSHPETFFGLHPEIAEARDEDLLLRHLVDWQDDAILEHAFAYQQVAGEGFFVESGVLHAPGTALTIELQEDADTLAMLQALNAGTIISKELLFKDVSAADRHELGERALLRWIDWAANGDPEFHRHRRLKPVPFRSEPGVEESWILYGSTKFSGKLVRLDPGARVVDVERGVHNMLAWRGTATVGGQLVRGGSVGEDELLVIHDAATRPQEIVNVGDDELTLIKFFGPDINLDTPDITTINSL